MSRYIDADLLLAQCRRNPIFEKTEKDKGMLYIERSIIDEIPTADVVEVVRCRDCKHYDSGTCNHFGYYTYAPDVDEDDYCSYGERRKTK